MAAVDGHVREVIDMLGLVEDPALLEEIAADLAPHIGDIEAIRGNLRALYRRLTNFINSDAFDGLEDGGVGFTMAARDKLRITLNLAAEDPDDNAKEEEEEYEDMFKDAVQDLKPLGLGEINAVNVGLGKLRELKLSGTIGKPGQKGKLTYSSLLSQLRNAIKRNFDDSEICAAVIRCIDPNTPLRNYLEELEDLTVEKMLPTLQSHFQEKNATALYHQMNNAVMSSDDTELSFCMELMALRDKIYKISSTQGGEYTKPLLQSQFQKALYTGIKNERVRQELKPYLSNRRVKPVTDQRLMAEITEICMLDQEHRAKVEESKSNRRGNISAVEVQPENNGNASTQNKPPKQPAKQPPSTRPRNEGKPETDVVAQLTGMIAPLTTQVCELYGAVEKLSQGVYGTAPAYRQPIPPAQSTPKSNLPSRQPQDQQQQDNGEDEDDGFDPHPIGFSQWAGIDGYSGMRGRGSWWPAIGRGAHEEEQDYDHGGWFYHGPVGRGNYNSGGGRGKYNNLGGGRGGPNNDRGRGGRGRGGRGRGGYNGHGNSSPLMCPSCTKANALYCNHCKICYKIEHRASNCPHRDDPNFKPEEKNS